MTLRQKEQKKAIENLCTAGWRGSWICSVGWGKSYNSAKVWKILKPKNTLVLVDQKKTLESIKKEWIGLGVDISSIDFYCFVNKHYKPNEYDFILLDEFDRMSNTVIKAFVNHPPLKSCSILGLTGTPPLATQPGKLGLMDKYFPICYCMPLNEAAGSIVSDYMVYMCALELDDTQKLYKAGSKNKGYYLTTEKGKYKAINRKISYLKGSGSMGVYNERKQFLLNAHTKINKIREVSDTLLEKGLKHIVFVGSIAEADKYECRVHSQIDGELYEGFLKDQYKRCAAVDSINRGVSVPGIKGALLGKLTFSGANEEEQKLGRIVRRDDGKPAFLFVFYFRDTEEEKGAYQFLARLDKKKVVFI